MNKKLFLLLIVLMSLSLIGIIFVQGYWIKRTVEDKEEQFSYNAKQILISVSKKLQNQEIENFWFEFADKDSTSSALDEDLINSYFKTDDAANEDTDGVLPGGSIEEDNKVSSDFLAYAQDSAQVSKLINRRVEDIFNDENVKPDQATSEVIHPKIKSAGSRSSRSLKYYVPAENLVFKITKCSYFVCDTFFPVLITPKLNTVGRLQHVPSSIHLFLVQTRFSSG